MQCVVLLVDLFIFRFIFRLTAGIVSLYKMLFMFVSFLSYPTWKQKPFYLPLFLFCQTKQSALTGKTHEKKQRMQDKRQQENKVLLVVKKAGSWHLTVMSVRHYWSAQQVRQS